MWRRGRLPWRQQMSSLRKWVTQSTHRFRFSQRWARRLYSSSSSKTGVMWTRQMAWVLLMSQIASLRSKRCRLMLLHCMIHQPWPPNMEWSMMAMERNRSASEHTLHRTWPEVTEHVVYTNIFILFYFRSGVLKVQTRLQLTPLLTASSMVETVTLSCTITAMEVDRVTSSTSGMTWSLTVNLKLCHVIYNGAHVMCFSFNNSVWLSWLLMSLTGRVRILHKMRLGHLPSWVPNWMMSLEVDLCR